MGTDATIALQCPNCKVTSEYKRKPFVTFGRVRCTNCDAIISNYHILIKKKLQILREMSYEPRTKEWAHSVYDIWAYILRSRDDLHAIDPQFRFDTCVELLQNGLTSIPGQVGNQNELTFVIPTLISYGFDAAAYLPANPPKVAQQSMLNVFAVHFKLFGKILENEERVVHFEFGAVNFFPNRWRIGTIVLTTKRLVVIGHHTLLSLQGERAHIKYPLIEKFSLETYKIQDRDDWSLEVRPEPKQASLYVSVDYFYLQDLNEYFQHDSILECTFRNQKFVKILQYGIPNPLRILRSYQTGWALSKISAHQKEVTGEYRIQIILSGDADYQKGIHGPIKRTELLVKALKEIVNPTIDTGSSYL